jgi:hypothetical protein
MNIILEKILTEETEKQKQILNTVLDIFSKPPFFFTILRQSKEIQGNSRFTPTKTYQLGFRKYDTLDVYKDAIINGEVPHSFNIVKYVESFKDEHGFRVMSLKYSVPIINPNCNVGMHFFKLHYTDMELNDYTLSHFTALTTHFKIYNFFDKIKAEEEGRHSNISRIETMIYARQLYKEKNWPVHPWMDEFIAHNKMKYPDRYKMGGVDWACIM